MPSDDAIPPLTAGELLRRKIQQNKQSRPSPAAAFGGSGGTVVASPANAVTVDNIDNEIQRLEAELAQGDNDDDDSNSSSSSSDDDSSDDHHQEEDDPSGVLRLSALDPDKDRIESLPGHLLPVARNSHKRILRNNDDDTTKSTKKQKTKSSSTSSSPSSGLAAAVKEVLNGYVARSSEKLPFYCRVCQTQYPNEQAFFAHKSTEFHKTAVEVERRASYCKLCRKQLTSPEQLKEHLQSRPHKERLQRVRERDGRGGSGRDNPNRGRGRGYTNQSRYTTVDR
jgi:hypothetical protein